MMPFVVPECKNHLASATGANPARICAKLPAFLYVLFCQPTLNFGFRLSDQELRMSVGLCFGADVVSGHTCTCRSTVLPDGHHGMFFL